MFDSCINFSYIVLNPKIKCPMKASNFKLISLYNFIYKLVSKVLANRLKKILSNIIFKNESVFMPNRLIIDNVIVAYEAFYSMKAR